MNMNINIPSTIISKILRESIDTALNEVASNGYDLGWINNKFDEFNDMYFQGKLEKIPIIARKMTTSNAVGCYKHSVKKDIRKYICGIVSVYPDDEQIIFNTSFKPNEEEILNTLIHEMCHQYAWEVEIYDKKFSEEEWSEFVKEYKATQGHDSIWTSIAEYVSSESGFKITRYSDTAIKTDDAKNTLQQMNERKKEIVLGVAHLSNSYFSFLTTRTYIDRIEHNISGTYVMSDGDDKFTWFTFHTNELNNKKGWCSKNNLGKCLQRVGDSIEDAVSKIKESLSCFDITIDDLQPLVVENSEQSFNTIVCLHYYVFASKYPYILFKPTPKLIKSLQSKPIDSYKLFEVDSEDIFRHVASSDCLGRGWLTNKKTEAEIEEYLNKNCKKWRKL